VETREFLDRFDTLSDQKKRYLMAYAFGFIRSSGNLDGLIEALEIEEESK
jgi:hypothetical protein